MALRAWAPSWCRRLGIRAGMHAGVRGSPCLWLAWAGPELLALEAWWLHARPLRRLPSLAVVLTSLPGPPLPPADPLGFNKIDGNGAGVRDGHMDTTIWWC